MHKKSITIKTSSPRSEDNFMAEGMGYRYASPLALKISKLIFIHCATPNLIFASQKVLITYLNHEIAPTRRSEQFHGGRDGIRTHGTVARTHAFQACSFDRSDTLPFHSLYHCLFHVMLMVALTPLYSHNR